MESLINKRFKLVYLDGTVTKTCYGLATEEDEHLLTLRFDDGQSKVIGKRFIISMTPMEERRGNHG